MKLTCTTIHVTQTAFLSGGNCLLTPIHINTYVHGAVKKPVNLVSPSKIVKQFLTEAAMNTW